MIKDDDIEDVEVELSETDHGAGSNISGLQFQMEMSREDLEVYIEDIAETVRIGLDQSIAILTPWFFNNMPKIYYQTTPRAEKVRHLSAVITGHVFETKQTVELWDRTRSKVTYIGPGGDRLLITDMASKLNTLDLKMGSLYFSRDNLLFLSTFLCEEHKSLDVKSQLIADKTAYARSLILQDYPGEDESADYYLNNLDNDFVIYATGARLQITYRMYRHMLNHEGAHTVIEPYENSPTARLTIGMRDVDIPQVLSQILTLFGRFDFDIIRGFFIRFTKGIEDQIVVMHFVIRHTSGERISEESIPVMKMIKSIRTLGWVDFDEYGDLTKEPYGESIGGANLIRSIATWIHVLLGKENPYYYSEYKIRKTFFSYPNLVEGVLRVFRLKFDPLVQEERGNGEYKTKFEEVKAEIDKLIDPVERKIFNECIKFIDCVYKTNYFLQTKTGIAFRLSPDVLDPKYYSEKPYGIFFIAGRDYRFFQIRWKDIARGGLRVVMPRSTSAYGFAMSGLFDEVYGLSYAQQMKNKDIPEGGSKAVLLLKPGGKKGRAVRGAINALLDLLVREDEVHEDSTDRLINYYDKEEIIYLGPDENMTNDLILWVPEQAKKRGYPYANAFISSKPNAGINHKHYGVTSEGLHVYVDHTLRFLGINPNEEKFSVRMTGGPDGDVAGNELKILHREYGENARVVGIADGFGAAYDPAGLDWTELLRLVTDSVSIADFDRSKLSKSDEAFVVSADTTENIRKRDAIHSQVCSDIFIPAGGRPYTVNEKNWHAFLGNNSKPTCRAIVEGANIFFTEEARKGLQKSGILMVKDSSANKTGVICSSYEIVASLLLTDEEFLEIKDEYVEQVIDLLRSKAAAEANLLYREYVAGGAQKTLVDLSKCLSQEINQVTDILLEEFVKDPKKILQDPLFSGIIDRHCPPVLVEKYHSRIHKNLPEAHKIAIVSAYIASYIVYEEGLGWLQNLAPDERHKAAIVYMHKAQKSEALVQMIKETAIDDKEQIEMILKKNAARELTMIELARQEQKDD